MAVPVMAASRVDAKSSFFMGILRIFIGFQMKVFVVRMLLYL
jgi:hypothetical protein